MIKFSRKLFAICAFLLCALSLSASGSKESDGTGLTIVTSFYPMYDFASKLAAEDDVVINLVPSGTEPHDWEPSTRDIITLEKADVFIYSGAGMEHWVEDVLASLSRSDLVVVEASAGITLLEGDDAHGHDHGGVDPHVWLDVENAIREMKNIRDGLIQADSSNSSIYSDNYDMWSERFKALDEEFETELAPFKGRSIVVSHEAFGYLCSAYGITETGISGIDPEAEPDPARMAYIENFVREHNISTIFTAELVNSKVASAIAAETGADVVFLSPLEGLTDEQTKSGGDYISVMKENLASIVSALERESL